MALLYYTAIDLLHNEIRNLRLQNLLTDPSFPSEGQFWFDSSNHVLKYYDGSIVRAVGVGLQGPEGLTGLTGPVGGVGPIGPAGPPGPTGTYYRFVQGVPADVWLVNHNLGYRPNVQAFDSRPQPVIGDIAHIDGNSLTITFAYAISGEAEVS